MLILHILDEKMSLTEGPSVAMVVCRDIALKLSLLDKIGPRQFLVQSLIKSYGLNSKMKLFPSRKATIDDLLTYHSRDYVELLSSPNEKEEEQEEHGLGFDCPQQEALLDWCLTVAGGSLTAAQVLVTGQARVAINWAGGWHHAHRDSAAGFCYVNDIVIAIHKLQARFKRILYVDLDVHHGDGVEEAFSSTDKVVTFSLHKCEPGFFPGTGHLGDVGTGRGRYHSVNVPLAEGVTDQMYRQVFSALLPHLMATYSPDCLVLQCGADSLVGDPLGGFNLTPAAITGCVKEMMSHGIPLLVLGGGGYNIQNAARCWTAVTATLTNSELEDDIPDEDHYFTKYGPDFTLSLSPGCVRNKNQQEDLDLMISTIKANIDLMSSRV